MLHIHSTLTPDAIEPAVRAAAQRHKAAVTVVSHLGHQQDAVVFTIYHSKLYTALLTADIRFAGYLPCRLAAWSDEGGIMLQALMPSEYCEILGRADLKPKAAPLDAILRDILEDASKPTTATAKGRLEASPHHWGATEDQVNMHATLPQRIDYRGTKVEDDAGTGEHDAPGG